MDFARWKARCRFSISSNEFFSLVLMAAALLREICRNRRFLKGRFERKFLVDGHKSRYL